MSRRYALIEHSTDKDNPEAKVEFTKNIRKAASFLKETSQRSTVLGRLFIRRVVEMPAHFHPPIKSELETIAMYATRPETPITWQDMLAYICTQEGRHVDL